MTASAASDTKPLLASPIKHKETTANAPTKLFGDPLWAPKAMYTIGNIGASAYVNYMAVYYEHTAQFTKFQIGLLQALPCISMIVGPPFWCAIADKFHIHRPIHITTIITGALLIFAIHFTTSFPLALGLILTANFVASPGGALLDHAILDMISKYGGEYGKQRLFGAVGYGLGAYLAGLVVAAGGIAWAFNLSLTFSFLSVLVLQQIPVLSHSHDEVEAEDSTKKPLERKPSFTTAMRALLHKSDVLVLMGVVFLMGLMYGVLSSFLTLNLYNLSNENPQIIGIAIMCETTSELPAFFFSQRIIDRLGVVGVLLVSISGYALRITYYAFMTNAWSAIPFEFLHGVTFGLAWAASAQYMYSASPKGAEGTMMGLLNAIQNGAGRGAGTLIGGYFYQNYGARTMWLVADLGVPLSLLGVAAFAYLKNQGDVQKESEVLELAAMLSPHTGDPQALGTPRYEQAKQKAEELKSYDTV